MDNATDWWLIATGVLIIGDYVTGSAPVVL
jgi:hypothetical protein